MNACVATSGEAFIQSAAAPARLALLGTGTVGRAVLARLAHWSDAPLGDRLSLVYAANSRFSATGRSGLPARRIDRLLGGDARSSHLDAVAQALVCDDAGDFHRPGGGRRGDSRRIVIDATASDDVADRHAAWLAHGIDVVTACKLGAGTSLPRWRAIQSACTAGGTHYGDSATVGAGLPLLRSIRELRAGGDRIHAIAGVLSGSLAWLFDRFDGQRRFSDCVREARDAGYTEPDPRDDLSGEDVRRKLLILARAAGAVLEENEIEVESLLPARLAALPREHVDAALTSLDAALRERHGPAHARGERLHYIARFEVAASGRTKARVGLESLAAGHPLCGGSGTDNRVAIWSDRYRAQPLLIQGPGAGAGVTAAALLDDVLRIAGGGRCWPRGCGVVAATPR